MSKKKSVRRTETKKKAAKKRIGAKYRVVHKVERVGATIPQTRAHLRKELESQMKNQLYRRETATSATDRKKAAKAIAETKKELKAIGGLKKKGRRKK